MVHIDSVPVENADEALALMVYHLRCAAQLFEATDVNVASRLPRDDFSYPAMAAWLVAIDSLYPTD